MANGKAGLIDEPPVRSGNLLRQPHRGPEVPALTIPYSCITGLKAACAFAACSES